MAAMPSITRLFAVPDDPDLVLAQASALARQVPLMYAMVVVNTLLLGATHYGVAPDLLSLYLPAALSIVSVARIVSWLRDRHKLAQVEHARICIGRMMRVMPVLSIGFSAWTISLLPYGDAYLQTQVVFFCSITTIACMFCLMHVRAAALTMGAVALVPLSMALLSLHNLVLTATVVNLVAVVVVLVITLVANYQDFAALVASRAAMTRKQAETLALSDENRRLANVDMLTNLPNRRAFDQHLADVLGAAGEGTIPVAVARLDLDNFKSINQIFGQTTGDRVLVEAARRIRQTLPPGSEVFRMGADDFALVLTGAISLTELQDTGDALCQSMRVAFDLEGPTIRLSASVGLAAARPGDSASMAYDRADYVTSLAKREARGTAMVFCQRHDAEVTRVRRMEHALRTANLDNEISILFQPQFNTALNCTIGYEVLARWHSPLLGEVSPAEFIPLAERSGLICRITQTVLRKALEASAKLPHYIRLSVNLSAHDVCSTTATEAIVDMLLASGLPVRIDFEITETAVMGDMKQANAALKTLVMLGARIALDDFGTGHSSLTHVQQLPLDRIKIDRSFVADISNDATSSAIVKTIADMCHNLDISCVFEGIETPEQLAALKAMGGTLMQGYLFGRPITEAIMQEQVAHEQANWGANAFQHRLITAI